MWKLLRTVDVEVAGERFKFTGKFKVVGAGSGHSSVLLPSNLDATKSALLPFIARSLPSPQPSARSNHETNARIPESKRDPGEFDDEVSGHTLH